MLKKPYFYSYNPKSIEKNDTSFISPPISLNESISISLDESKSNISNGAISPKKEKKQKKIRKEKSNAQKKTPTFLNKKRGPPKAKMSPIDEKNVPNCRKNKIKFCIC